MLNNNGIFRKIIFIFSVVFFVRGCTAHNFNEYRRIDEGVNNFITHLLARDEEYIVKNYLGSSPDFSSHGRFTKATASFLYESEPSRGKKSILNVISNEIFSTKIIWQNRRTFTLLVTRKDDFNNLNNLSFLQNEWMKKYFACEFVITEDSMLLYQNICFAETDGPFPQDEDF